MYHEDVCNRLRERMERAAEKDRSSHEKKLPATAKLAMLEDVMAVLRK
jgi:transcription factor SPN1